MTPRLDIRLTVSSRGCLQGFEAAGHAGPDPAGTNVACAAATTLLRTTGKLCADRGLVSAGSAEAPGVMTMALAREAPSGDWLRGVTDFLLRGLGDLAQEFPREIRVRMEMTEV